MNRRLVPWLRPIALCPDKCSAAAADIRPEEAGKPVVTAGRLQGVVGILQELAGSRLVAEGSLAGTVIGSRRVWEDNLQGVVAEGN